MNQNTNENVSAFLPYLSKTDQIKKRMQIITVDSGNSELGFVTNFVY